MLKYLKEIIQTLWKETPKTKVKPRKARESRFDIKKGKTSITPEILAPNTVNEKHDIENSKEIVRLKRTYDMLMKKFVNPRLDLVSPGMKTLEKLKFLDFRKKTEMLNSSITNVFTGRQNKKQLPVLDAANNNLGKDLKPPVSKELSLGWSGQPTDKNDLHPKVETASYPHDIASALFEFPELANISTNKKKQSNKVQKRKFKKTNQRKQSKKLNSSDNFNTIAVNSGELVKEIPKSHLGKYFGLDYQKQEITEQQHMISKPQGNDISQSSSVIHDHEDEKIENSNNEENINENKSSLNVPNENLSIKKSVTPTDSAIFFKPHQETSETEQNKTFGHEKKLIEEQTSEGSGEPESTLKSHQCKSDTCLKNPSRSIKNIQSNEELKYQYQNVELNDKTNPSIGNVKDTANNIENLKNKDISGTSYNPVLTTFTEVNLKQHGDKNKGIDFGKGVNYSLKEDQINGNIETSYHKQSKKINSKSNKDSVYEKNIPVDSKHLAIGKEHQSYPIGKEHQSYPNGKEYQSYPIGKEHQSYPIGKEHQSYPIGKEHQSHPMTNIQSVQIETQNISQRSSSKHKTHKTATLENTIYPNKCTQSVVSMHNSLRNEDKTEFPILQKKETLSKTKISRKKSVKDDNKKTKSLSCLGMKEVDIKKKLTFKNEDFQSQNILLDANKRTGHDKNVQLKKLQKSHSTKYKKAAKIKQVMSKKNSLNNIVATKRTPTSTKNNSVYNLNSASNKTDTKEKISQNIIDKPITKNFRGKNDTSTLKASREEHVSQNSTNITVITNKLKDKNDIFNSNAYTKENISQNFTGNLITNNLKAKNDTSTSKASMKENVLQKSAKLMIITNKSKDKNDISNSKAFTKENTPQKYTSQSLANNLKANNDVYAPKGLIIDNKYKTSTKENVSSSKPGKMSNVIIIKPIKISKHEGKEIKEFKETSAIKITNSIKGKKRVNNKNNSTVMQSDYLKFVKNKAWYFDHSFKGKKKVKKSDSNISVQEKNEDKYNLKGEKQQKNYFLKSTSATDITKENDKNSKTKLLKGSKSSNTILQNTLKKNMLKNKNSLIYFNISKKNKLMKRTKEHPQKIFLGTTNGMDSSLNTKLLDKKSHDNRQGLEKRIKKIIKRLGGQHLPNPNQVQQFSNETSKRKSNHQNEVIKKDIRLDNSDDFSNDYSKLLVHESKGNKNFKFSDFLTSTTKDIKPQSKTNIKQRSLSTITTLKSDYSISPGRCDIKEDTHSFQKHYPSNKINIEDHLLKNIFENKTKIIDFNKENSNLKYSVSKSTGLQTDTKRKLHSKKAEIKPVNLKMYGVGKHTDKDQLSDIPSLKSVDIINKKPKNKELHRAYYSNMSLKKSSVTKNKRGLIQPSNIIFPTNLQTRNLFTMEHKANMMVNYLLKRYATTATNQNKPSTAERKNNNNVETVHNISNTFKNKSGNTKHVGCKIMSNVQERTKYKSQSAQHSNLGNKNIFADNIFMNESSFRQKEIKVSCENKRESEKCFEKPLGKVKEKTKPMSNPALKEKDYDIEVLYSRKEISSGVVSKKQTLKNDDKINTKHLTQDGFNVITTGSKTSALNTSKQFPKYLNQKAQNSIKETSSVHEKCTELPSKTLNIINSTLNKNVKIKRFLSRSKSLDKVNMTTKDKQSNRQMSANANQSVEKAAKKTPVVLKQINTTASIISPPCNDDLNKNVKINSLQAVPNNVQLFDIMKKNPVNMGTSLPALTKNIVSSVDGITEKPQKWKSKTDRLNDRASYKKTFNSASILAKKRTNIKSNISQNNHNNDSSGTNAEQNEFQISIRKGFESFGVNKQTITAPQKGHKIDENVIILSNKGENLNALEVQRKERGMSAEKKMYTKEKVVELKSNSTVRNSKKLVKPVISKPAKNLVSELLPNNNVQSNNIAKDSLSMCANEIIVSENKGSGHNSALNKLKRPVAKVVLSITGTGNNNKILNKKDGLKLGTLKFKHPNKNFPKKIIRSLTNLCDKRSDKLKNSSETPHFSRSTQSICNLANKDKLPQLIQGIVKVKYDNKLNKKGNNDSKPNSAYENKSKNIVNLSRSSLTLSKSSSDQIKQPDIMRSDSINVLSDASKKKLDIRFSEKNFKEGNDYFNRNYGHNMHKSSTTLHEGLMSSVALARRIAMGSHKDTIIKHLENTKSGKPQVPKILKEKPCISLKPSTIKSDFRNSSFNLEDIKKVGYKIEANKFNTLIRNQTNEKQQVTEMIKSSNQVYKRETPKKQTEQKIHPIEKETFGLDFTLKTIIPVQKDFPNHIKQSFNSHNLQAVSDQFGLSLKSKNSESKDLNKINTKNTIVNKQIKSWRPDRTVTCIKNASRSNVMQMP